MPDNQIRSRLNASLERVRVPRTNLDDVVRRAKTSRIRRSAAGVVVALVAVLGILVPLGLLGSLSGNGDSSTVAGTEETLAVSGIEVMYPEDWSARVYYVSGYTRPLIRLASFELPEIDDVIGTAARSQMRETDALISLTEYSAVCPPCPGFVRLESPPTLGELDGPPFAIWNQIPPQDQDLPDSHELDRLTFQLGDRFIDLWVEFGSDPGVEATRAQASTILNSLSIGGFAPPAQPDGVCNEWSPSNDPDCPSNAWLRIVLIEAGFEPVENTGEATLVVQGGGARFFAWVEEATTSLEDGPRAEYLVVDGVSVYGGETELVWESHGLHVWIAGGPFEGDTIPDLSGIRDLVRAAENTPFTQE